MQSLYLMVETEPVPASRPRVSRWGGVGYGKRYTKFRKAVAEAIPKALAKAGINPEDLPLDGALEVEFVFNCHKPKKPAHKYPRGDVDNYMKAIQDSLESAGVFINDSQIVRVTGTKKYAEEVPCIAVHIKKVSL